LFNIKKYIILRTRRFKNYKYPKMKKIILLALAITLFSSAGYTQWFSVSQPTQNDLYSLFFTSDNTGFVSGATSSYMYKTTNGGANFTSHLITSTASVWNDIFIIDSQTGYTVGYPSKIAKTTNSGVTWYNVFTGNSSNTLHCVYFPSASTGYAAGGNVIVKTTNSGENWYELPYTNTSYLVSVNFINNTTGYISGSEGYIAKTTNGGSSWNYQSSPSAGYNEEIIMVDANTGFCAGQYGTILKTTNGGTNWTNTVSSPTWFYDLWMLNSSTGWVCGQNGIIMRTTNGGVNWITQQTNTNKYIRQIQFVNQNTGYAVGYNGTILKTTNGGGEMFSDTSRIFQKVTSGSIVNLINSGHSAAWADLDNDGDQDVVVTSFNNNCSTCENQLLMFTNNGDGTFSRVINNAITNQSGVTTGLAWGDYNNDGWPDLYVCSLAGGKNFLFKNNGDGNFTKITSGDIANIGGMSESCSWGDYNRDGWLDLFVANKDNYNDFLFKNNGNGTFTRITTGEIVNDGLYSRGCAWGDYDNDGWPDLYVVTYQGQNDILYRNNQDGGFTKITTGPEVNTPTWGFMCQWVDYDNDMDMDLFVTSNPTNKLYRNNGDGSFTFIDNVLTQEGNSYGFTWADFNNDGYQDLYTVNESRNNTFFKGTGTSFVKLNYEITNQEGSYSSEASSVDINNDGRLDLFVTNRFNNYNFLYKNISYGSNYITFYLTGCNLSNKSAIGAKINIYKGSFRATREISGGRYSQDMLWQHFGLGQISNLDSVVIRWPSGARKKLVNVPANQRVILDECSTGIIQNSNAVPVAYSLSQNYPNPFNPTTKIKFSIPKSGFAELKIYDNLGREINTLVSTNLNSGIYETEFDGSGLSSGIYFYQLRAGEFIETKRMVLTK
jgi:photosystem II stability/assembly factor-like uncharacterized protein/uncharacterized protein YuzB (UPF0349 family)